MMQEDKIKKELQGIEKMEEGLYDIIAQQVDLQDQGKDDSDEYIDLVGKEIEIAKEIHKKMLLTKYVILTVTGFNPEAKFDVDLPEEERAENLKNHLEMELLVKEDGIKRRIDHVDPLFLELKEYPDRQVRKLYDQVVRCYTYGAFEASCVLCRGIAENMIRVKCKDESTAIYGLLKKINKPKIKSLYSEIAEKANKILHKTDEKTEEEDALKAIEHLQSFIKTFFR